MPPQIICPILSEYAKGADERTGRTQVCYFYPCVSEGERLQSHTDGAAAGMAMSGVEIGNLCCYLVGNDRLKIDSKSTF